MVVGDLPIKSTFLRVVRHLDRRAIARDVVGEIDCVFCQHVWSRDGADTRDAGQPYTILTTDSKLGLLRMLKPSKIALGEELDDSDVTLLGHVDRRGSSRRSCNESSDDTDGEMHIGSGVYFE